MLLFVDNLTNVDFSYLHPERGMLGETWLANTALDGALDAQGMVCDFGNVKKRLRHFLDTRIDHCLLVPAQSKHLELLENGDTIELVWRYGKQALRCRSPRQAIVLIDAPEITAASVAQWCVMQLKPQFEASIAELRISFDEEPINSAFYHYSHGLKKHGGNCQRIAHGHRSRIHIWRNGVSDPALEKDWATRWQDIYLGTQEDLVANENGLLKFAYRAQQGAFELDMPANHCYMLDTDTTVEWLATHIAHTLAAEAPGDTIRVQAFEGINKGAIVEACVKRQ
ncbi:6-carboxytetrahydropterin synthase [Simiduia sp. 21SJ11W-1]|uniref:6-carboxytetrahydropterin synthase n=1 Tax=Simiduia sp. 21SJ11W-1 TaxID=2909669 RepID=UPI0020A11B06|nr:6-carboxytetrahydropterin synthase [Simiduia sp. 21SJ11W-1]UTA49229.1 6-carboxytetrahydropterin synthase [Simiduia sp. 21SJ11W-1]